MSVVSIAGRAVTKGEIRLPLTGAWTAELEVQGTELLTGSVTLTVGDVDFTGTAKSEADQGNLVSVSVVGGADGLGTECPPRHWTNSTSPVSVRSILEDALGIGGERLSSDADATTTAVELAHWMRMRCTVADSLRGVLGPRAANWRLLPDGSVWVGPETWPTVDPEHVVVGEQPTEAMLTIAIESADVRPGMTFLGRQVSSVTYTVDDAAIRAHIAYGEARGGIVADLAELIRRETAKVRDFGSVYLCRVVAQNADGTLELQPTTDALAGMSSVPLRAPPGVSEIRVLPGTLVVLAFDNLDASRPYCGLSMLTGCSKLLIECPDVRLGSDAAEFLAIASKVDQNFQALATTLGTGTAGGNAVTFTALFTPVSVAATKVKGE